jgi:Arc/MetJ family transcription regulator
MRTNIEIDDELMQQAMAATNTTTKKAAVEASLRQTVQLKEQEGIREYFGKVDWQGDLDEMRQSRFQDSDVSLTGPSGDQQANDTFSIVTTPDLVTRKC